MQLAIYLHFSEILDKDSEIYDFVNMYNEKIALNTMEGIGCGLKMMFLVSLISIQV